MTSPKRAPAKSGPHATFRRWAMDSTSYHVLLPFLDNRDRERAESLLKARAANAAALELKV